MASTSDNGGQERRRRNRVRVSMRATLETARGRFDCRVLDLSPTGACIRLLASVEDREPVTLHLNGSDKISGVVAWRRNTYLGVQFFERLSDSARAAAPLKGADRAAPAPKSQPQSQAQAQAQPQPQAGPRAVEPLLLLPAIREVPPAAESTPRSNGPRLDTERIAAMVAQLQTELIERIDVAQAARIDRDQLAREIDPLVNQIISERNLQLNGPERAAAIKGLVAEMVGFGPLEPLLADESVSDILVDGPKRVYVERRGKLESTDVTFIDDRHVLNVATRIVTLVGRRIDESTPLVDARLPDGSRVNVIVPPLALDGPMISIRKFAKQVITLERMVEQGNLSASMAAVIAIATRSRLNILISGGTGSGKTTLLNAMSRTIDPGERIITIEDAAELQLQQPRVGRLETRMPNLEGKGAVTIRDLFRNALRMRPDRIIVGEIRGSECLDMLQAMNSGHDGSLGTIHASGPREALTRLENLLDMSGMNLSSRAQRAQIASAVDMIVQVSRMRDGKRRITSVMEVVGMESDVIVTQELFHYRFDREGPNGELVGEFVGSGLRPHFLPDAEMHGLGRELMRAAVGETQMPIGGDHRTARG
ncbi:MAG TPA: ATPase, T2SS/T4P/T4SS family [Stellaceae bacterium]|nr:ATPase, T2SS/T4P/T4SS family [Stellaceae bacterium]